MARLEIIGPNGTPNPPVPGGGGERLEMDEKGNPSGGAMKGEESVPQKEHVFRDDAETGE